MKTVLTHNGMGHSFLEADPIQDMLRTYCENGDKHILEIGAGVGANSLYAYSCGNNVVTNDMSQSHLDLIKSKSEEMKDEKCGTLSYALGVFPDQLDFEASQFDVIVAFQMFHFLRPRQIDIGLEKAYKWLKTGGKVFITVTSPYIKALERFMGFYYKRLNNGKRFPGEFPDARARIPERFRTIYPSYMNLMDENVLKRAIPEDKFEIEELTLFKAKTDSPLIKLDGREHVGIVIRKK